MRQQGAPFWDHAVVFAVDGGFFGHVHYTTAAPLHHYDGTYRRVVLFKRGGTTRLLISVQGKRIGPIELHHGKRWSARRLVDGRRPGIEGRSDNDH